MERADVAALTERARDFHGHMCPGLAIGIQAARIGIAVCGHDSDEDVVAVVETDMCAVDAIQALMGCTFGKGNLVHRDYGKAAFTFFRRRDGESVRLLVRPDLHVLIDPEFAAARERLIAAPDDAQAKAILPELAARCAARMLARDPEELFSRTTPQTPTPRRHPVEPDLRPLRRNHDGVALAALRRPDPVHSLLPGRGAEGLTGGWCVIRCR